MSQDKLTNLQNDSEVFKPLSEEEERKIRGGDSAMVTICHPGEHWDYNLNKCIADEGPATQHGGIPV